ncbi:VWA domain-containing protein [Nocardia uniformis]|uniref:VWA domain-containing protein n=1 Tax=Nocardia uniformis TaxID=53432 RepID=A0A849C7V2_9NOCA|nr:VWA domain-containing protein [Nocardia uniformis]NNH73866.1 VWA domain-containing protein [Nocardia uniformis]
MPNFTRIIAGFAIGLIALGLTTSSASAQPDAQYAPTMLILDASGSMQRPDPAGTMMDAAKNAVRSFVGSAPDAAQVGLATYGTSTGNTEAEKAAGCQDVSILRRAETIDRTALNTAVDGIQPRGWTPMGTALRQVAQSLPDSGARSIVLVSDGDDTCSPPEPCDVARELKQQGLDLVVHTIGFAVDDKARTQLDCVAKTTGGTYSDAVDGPALERILPKVSTAALRKYEATGSPITGTANYHEAPVAAPGQYLDSIGQRETRYYAVDVPLDATAYFTGIVSFPRLANISSVDDFNRFDLRVYGKDGQDCRAAEHEQASRSSDGVTLTISKTWDGATKVSKSQGGTSKYCTGAGRYYFALTWDKISDGVPERLPLELLVGIESATTDPGPVAVLPTTEFVEPTGDPTPVTGGGSFNVATTLDDSGRYTDTLRPGEYVFYRVRLNWGQGLAYRVHFEANGERGTDVTSNITTTLYSPLAHEIDMDSFVYTGRDGVLPSHDPSMATVPIRYNNRQADKAEVRKQALAGWYYIAVKLGSTASEGGNTPVPIRLHLTVSGDQEAGPTYAEGTANGVLGDDKSPTSKSPGESEVTMAEREGEPSNNVLMIAAIGGVGVAVLAAIALVLLRRRRG